MWHVVVVHRDEFNLLHTIGYIHEIKKIFNSSLVKILKQYHPTFLIDRLF